MVIPLTQKWPDEFAKKYRAAGYWTGETFSDFLEERSRIHPDTIAVTDDRQSWTYAELVEQSIKLACGFLALGLKPGDRVLVQLPNIAEFLSVSFGLFRAGLIPVYALPAHRITELSHFARIAEVKAFVTAKCFSDLLDSNLASQLQNIVPGIAHIITVRDDTFDHPPPNKPDPFPDLSTLNADETILPPLSSPSDVALLQISGGSTGLPKLIPRTHDDYIYSFRASAEICKLDHTSVYLAVLPVAHNFPMSSPGVLGTLYVGGYVVMSPSCDADIAFSLIAKNHVTLTSVVPPLALLWLQAAKTSEHDISSLQLFQVGGAKLIPEVAQKVHSILNCKLQQVFGMAEGLVNYTRLDDPEQLIVKTQGRPISAADEILIVDDHDHPVPTGNPGYLLVRGPYTIRSYHNNEAANSQSFTGDGFYRTGDIVTQTKQDYLIVQGRKGDHINRAGEKISAEEVENYIIAHPNVFDAAVVSIPDQFLGERSCAFIILQNGKPKKSAIKSFIRERGIANFKIPDQIIFVDQFQVTAAKKVSRKDLRESLRNNFLQQEKEET